MRRTITATLAAACLALALAGPVAAHVVIVNPPGGGGGAEQWVGGGPVPGQGKALLPSPIGNLPPSHANGLPTACHATDANPSAATFRAPPYFTGCHHGQP